MAITDIDGLEVDEAILPELKQLQLSLNQFADEQYRGLFYHYTDIPALEAMVNGETIRFTELSYMNDPTEQKYGLEIGVAEIQRFFGTDTIAGPLSGLVEQHLKDFQFWSTFICCFSRDGDSLSQWRGYSNDGRGVAMGFHPSISPDTLQPLVAHESFDVQYDGDALAKVQRKGVIEVLRSLKRHSILSRDTQLYQLRRCAQMLGSYFLRNSSFFKHPAYMEEREVRLMIGGLRSKTRDIEGYGTRKRPNGTEAEFIDLGLTAPFAKMLRRVRLGPATTNEDMIEVRVILRHLPDVDVVRSEIPYEAVK